ncbi:single-stranded DNA-binding protein [Methylosinus sp. H3A]|uniref:single-stranded DNA-binding protein n=1 Tax=Methylosinus sp. H3A TaxID=2785786 RepID=UPI0018C31C22|nr:single-stranded DNA-binding protein [Methylosinus sp. H3A]MBG0812338.1 single-stranded DNA-binding protein [Methylosinus sp. H3A]
MTSRNFFVISGNVSQAPRQFGDRTPKTVITIGVDEFWTDKETGERKKKTDFLTAFTFNRKIGDYIIANVKIGWQVNIDGRIRANSYEKGADRIYTTELEIGRIDAHPISDTRGGDDE